MDQIFEIIYLKLLPFSPLPHLRLLPMATKLGARRVLHYSCALTTFIFIVASILTNLGHVRRRKNDTKRHSRFSTILIGLLILSYVLEGVAVAAQENDLVRSQAHIFHIVSLALIWSVIGVRQLGHNTIWYEILGISGITSIFEVSLLILSSFRGLDRFGSASQLVSQATRILILLYLLADTGNVRLKSRKALVDESQPILHRNYRDLPTREANYDSTPLLDHPVVEDDGSLTDSGIDNSYIDSDDDGDIKEIRKKRLQETGSWWIYLRDFSIFLPYLIPRKDLKVQACIVVSLICLACNRVLNVLVPRQLGIVADKLLAKEAPYGSLGIWLLLDLMSGESGLGLIEELVKIPIKQFSYRHITNAAFNHVMNLEMEFHAERDSAEVMKAIEQGESLTNLLETAVLEIAPTFVDLLIASVFLYWKFNVYVSLALVVASIGYISVEVFTSNWNIPYRRRVAKAEREEARVMHQAVQGWQTVLYFNRFAYEKHRFGESVETHLTASRHWSKRDAYIKAITELWIPTTFFGLAGLILYDISRGQASAGDFVFYIQYWDTLIYPLKFLSSQYRWLMSDLVDAERLLILLQTKPTVTDKEGAKDLGPVKGYVAFKHVHFSYDPRRPTIEDVNISAAPGETVALVGTTGAGKSSILKLLLRFYDVSSGQIEIDGHDIRDVTLGSLRDVLGVVPQDPLLFNASIMENLRYARPSATDDEVFAACRAAAIHDKILTFADRYDTGVGEQGVKLSRGELQRLAIARVFLKDPPIFILDEATSAVDTDTEYEIQSALEILRARRTTFVIAHRLSTVVSADQILVVHNGRIVESGTHQELLRRDGRYMNLWTKQAGGELKKK
ncbi:hypothetical protein BGZ60DRAFT_445376 [Tricladium varicosporioides]|nr:hypothetical protein BGZ60DRAFT_445376 [Hymenoscyphus varicosporioides]